MPTSSKLLLWPKAELLEIWHQELTFKRMILIK